jgi:hypothetical protein
MTEMRTPTLTAFAAPRGEQVSLGAARREVTTPTLTAFAAPRGEQASLGAARREAR